LTSRRRPIMRCNRGANKKLTMELQRITPRAGRREAEEEEAEAEEEEEEEVWSTTEAVSRTTTGVSGRQSEAPHSHGATQKALIRSWRWLPSKSISQPSFALSSGSLPKIFRSSSTPRKVVWLWRRSQ